MGAGSVLAPVFNVVPSWLQRYVPHAVKSPIPIAHIGADTVRWWIGVPSLALRLVALLVACNCIAAQERSDGPPGRIALPVNSVLSTYCIKCHDAEMKKGGLDLERVSQEHMAQHADEWERVIRKLRARQMPPIGKDRPTEKAYEDAVTKLASSLDRNAARHPNPGRTETFRRLNRTEYQNSIRDLLALEIDAAALLPKEDTSHGFDNVTVGDLSPTLLNRYISAAEKVS